MRILCLVFLFLSGCVSAQFAPAKLGETFPSRTPPEKIEFYRTQKPDKQFVEIGALNVCCHINTERMLKMLREKASEVGGDAILGFDLYGQGGATSSVIRFGEN